MNSSQTMLSICILFEIKQPDMTSHCTVNSNNPGNWKACNYSHRKWLSLITYCKLILDGNNIYRGIVTRPGFPLSNHFLNQRVMYVTLSEVSEIIQMSGNCFDTQFLSICSTIKYCHWGKIFKTNFTDTI